MKISKLFHWLYAILMLLPILAIGVTCGYAMFNKNAYQSYASEQSTSVQEINSYQSLYVNETYTISSVRKPSTGQYNTPIFSFEGVDDFCKSFGLNNNLTYVAVNFIISATGNNFVNGYTELDTISRASENHGGTVVFINNRLPVTFKLTHIYAPSGYQSLSDITIYRNFTHKLELSEIFYHSIDKVQQSPLFNWAENSFLVTPFAYIVNLFSMPTNSPIVMFLSYWLAISIIWLVFDLIMYVPLLVHRWLDKGVLE